MRRKGTRNFPGIPKQIGCFLVGCNRFAVAFCWRSLGVRGVRCVRGVRAFATAPKESNTTKQTRWPSNTHRGATLVRFVLSRGHVRLGRRRGVLSRHIPIAVAGLLCFGGRFRQTSAAGAVHLPARPASTGNTVDLGWVLPGFWLLRSEPAQYFTRAACEFELNSNSNVS